ncbi:Acetylpolyamine aminohydrolase [Hartmannibacter diazotrophicus]|uniref:Acetylpolyamine aminohydrolase n=1 Tax=Hartmannibacter diazotrophicus TaxID=1482074 RepID=A0A2C9DCP6_9HYPH|nr:histone deacetylase family protein [Hartmannibacter diazotrophicus]SON58102.1 Acetylpolyamine aminohydrolase [Hartmannibacter diazotrophicus]
MQTFFSEDHRLHFPQGELHGGELVTPFERPSRVEYVLRQLKERGFPAVTTPDAVDLSIAHRVHDAGFLNFLETAWDEWKAAGNAGEIIATGFAARRMSGAFRPPPRDIDGKVGYYALAAETAITGGTWKAACSSLASAQSAQRHVAAKGGAAFALCRPPGHHAASDMFGGYCFINNAAVVAEMFRLGGAGKVAVLDVDFHHGNGTQEILYARGDVLFASLHGHPEDAYPYFTGYADESGEGEGEGATANYPMRPGTAYGEWSQALDEAIARIKAFGAEALVVSLGVDAYKDDPISFFKLESEDFRRCGNRLAKGLGLPTVFLMEGGYAIEAVGINTVNVLEGFAEG